MLAVKLNSFNCFKNKGLLFSLNPLWFHNDFISTLYSECILVFHEDYEHPIYDAPKDGKVATC